MMQVVNQWTEAKRLRVEWIMRYKGTRHPRSEVVKELEDLGDNPSPEAVEAIRRRFGAVAIPTHYRCDACKQMYESIVLIGCVENDSMAYLCAKCLLEAFKLLENA